MTSGAPVTYRRALITGASSGIGAATARALAARGLDLLLIARRADRLAAMREALRAEFKVDVKIEALDVRDAESVRRLVEAGALDGVDVLVNNAGLARGVEKVQDGRLADWDAMIDTNIKGLLYLSRAALPGMIAAKRGHVVNIGSVAGRWVYPGGAVYCATKFAVRALSEGMRMDLLGTPVRVTNIEPGMVETEFSEVRLGDVAQAKAVYEGMTPLTAVDIADAVVWCLAAPPHVNVQELVVFPTAQAAVGQVQRRP
jgi:NADP-dependent 3-hydroxy acid dehydrogenase YdfG